MSGRYPLSLKMTVLVVLFALLLELDSPHSSAADVNWEKALDFGRQEWTREPFDESDGIRVAHDEQDAQMMDLLRDMLERVKHLEKLSEKEKRSRPRRSSPSTCDCQTALNDVMMRATHMVEMQECYKEADGSDYRGSCGHTANGQECQNWMEQSPHSHLYFTGETPAEIEAGIGNHSNCRNPDGANSPWCFTMREDTRIEYCGIGNHMESCKKSNFTLVGATYVRYGRYDCPVGVELVYSGFVAGTSSVHQGGGSDFLCMPEDPIYDDDVVVDDVQVDRAYLYHSQYARLTGSKRLARTFKGNAPCAVCRTPNRNSIIMVPARNICPDETWNLEYHGMLAAQRSAIRSYTSEYICIDTKSVKLSFSGRSLQGNEIFNVEGRCSAKKSAMSCDGSYVDGAELTCAVCSK